MDIFRVLGSTADQEGALRLVVACLAYLLNPEEDHGLGAALLWRVLRELDGVNSGFAVNWGELADLCRRSESRESNVVVKTAFATLAGGESDQPDLSIEIFTAENRYLLGFLVDITPTRGDLFFRLTQTAAELRRQCGGMGTGQHTEAALVYLVPPDQSQLRGLALYPEVDLKPYDVHGPIAFPWLAIEPLPDLPRSSRETRTSLERLIQQVMMAHVHGTIPSADSRAIDLLRDLRSSCRNGFDIGEMRIPTRQAQS
jgi:hypothetical protein